MSGQGDTAAGAGKASLMVDVAVSIPELSDIGTFWLRRQPARTTLAALYQECLGHPEVRRSGSLSRFHQVRASRHFWCGDTMLLRGDALDTALKSADSTPDREIALVLRPDYYQVTPPQFLHPGIEYTYLDAEVPVGDILPQILAQNESGGCFEVFFGSPDGKRGGRRLDAARSLAAQGAFPAWQESRAAFPIRARLRVQPRRSPLIGAIYLAGALAGGAAGFFLIQRLLASG